MYRIGKQFEFDLDRAKANPNGIVSGDNYRFTVLSSRLLRLEYSKTGNFVDLPTQLVINRKNNFTDFKVREDNNYLEITTKYFTLQYNKNSSFVGTKLNPSINLRVTLNNPNLKQGDAIKEWYYQKPEVKRFDSPGVSLDNKTMYTKGLYSLDGYSSLDDSKSFLINEDGTLLNRIDKDNIDIYLFMYDKDFNLALKDYFFITGKPLFIPRYVLGNWWSKDYKYNKDDIRELIFNFEKCGIPLSVLLLTDWDNSNNKNSSYSFNNDLGISNEFINKFIHAKGMRLGIRLNPKYGINNTEVNYPEALKYLKDNHGIIPFNVFNPVFIDIYLKLFIHPLENYGVDLILNDYDDFNNISAFKILNHYQSLDINRNLNKRSLILSRNSMNAMHRYGILYTGKSKVGWDSLKSIPYYNLSGYNMGLSWISHDIGGNNGGIEDSELYIRSVELGVFSPIFRFNANGGKYYKREPWRWDAKTSSIVSKYMNLRHKLIPYIYTSAYNYSNNLEPLIKPVYIDYQWVYDDDVYRNEYYFGSELLIAPIVFKKDLIMNRTIHKFFIPDGVWYDFVTGKKFMGGKKYVSFFKEEDYPYFAKSGAIVPVSTSNSTHNKNPEELEIHVFPGKSNMFTMYEDDGCTSLYKNGFYLKTNIEYNYLKNNFTLIIRSTDGKSGIVPEYRNYKIRFRNCKGSSDVKVNFNNEVVDFESYIDENDFVVIVNDIPSIGQLTVNCRGNDIEIDAVRVINEDIDSILMDLQIETSLKEKMSDIMFGDLPIKKKRIAIRKLRRLGLDKNYMKLFLKLLEYINTI